MKYSVLLFDADNTLLDFDRSAKESFSEVLEHLGIEEAPWHFKRYLRINRECWQLLERGEISPEEVKVLRFERFLESIDHSTDFKKVGYHYLEALSRRHYLESGALDLLRLLQKTKVRLGLITNGLSMVQWPRFRNSGLEPIFETIVISEEIGVAKPMPAYFEHTLEQLDHPHHSEILIIGDTPGSDILGGQNMGFDTCWYNPRQQDFPFDPGPTFVVHQLQQIKDLVFPGKVNYQKS